MAERGGLAPQALEFGAPPPKVPMTMTERTEPSGNEGGFRAGSARIEAPPFVGNFSGKLEDDSPGIPHRSTEQKWETMDMSRVIRPPLRLSRRYVHRWGVNEARHTKKPSTTTSLFPAHGTSQPLRRPFARRLRSRHTPAGRAVEQRRRSLQTIRAGGAGVVPRRQQREGL